MTHRMGLQNDRKWNFLVSLPDNFFKSKQSSLFLQIDQDRLRGALNDRPTISSISLPVCPRVCPVEGRGDAKPQEKQRTFSGEPSPLKDLGGKILTGLRTL